MGGLNDSGVAFSHSVVRIVAQWQREKYAENHANEIVRDPVLPGKTLMNIESLLFPRKKILLQRWFDILVRTYPPETVRMLKKETNQFANPVGHTSLHAMDEILDEFLQENQVEKISPLLDRIIRIRAVQDFAPSQALAFVFLLKDLARELLADEIAEGKASPADLAEFDSRVDGMALAAMDVYSKCRDTLYEVRIKEIKARTNRLLLRAEIIAELPERKPGDENQ